MTANAMSNILPTAGARSAFDALAKDYDQIFTLTQLGRAHRSLVHERLLRHLRKGQRILDLNCGTGEDALYLASLGMCVWACDISERMIAVARHKAARSCHGSGVAFMVCANENLGNFRHSASFDAVLSNFGGLNCSRDLTPVARELSRLVRPGGRVFLCAMSRFCLWETLWYSRVGDWSRAFRRLRKGGTRANIAGASVEIHYPSVHDVRRAFAPSFRLVSTRGIGVVLPPSWLVAHLEHHPRLIGTLKHIDRYLCGMPIVRGLADHTLFELVREEQ